MYNILYKNRHVGRDAVNFHADTLVCAFCIFIDIFIFIIFYGQMTNITLDNILTLWVRVYILMIWVDLIDWSKQVAALNSN